MSERDYSGVATRDLAGLIRGRVPEEQEVWAESRDLSRHAIRRVMSEHYQFTGLALADMICNALGENVSEVLTVIPSQTANAARKMAVDELEVFSEIHGLPAPTQEDIDLRVIELEALRQATLGPPTAEQLDRLSRDSDRSKERLSRQRNSKGSRTPGEAGLLRVA